MHRLSKLSLAALLALAACKMPEPPQRKAAAPEAAGTAQKAVTAEIDPIRLAAFQPLPANFDSADNPGTPEKVALGQMLYHEKRLSKSQEISCNSCHGLGTFGVDNQKTSPGHNGQLGGRNSPTVYNAALHFAQFWDGRAATVEEQAKGPVLNPVEMAMPDAKRVEAVLNSMPEYVEAFKKAFPDDKKAVSFDNMAKAIGAFERKLATPARWDKFLGGDKMALTDAEKAGFNKFLDAGCMACHMGPGLGGSMYQKLGLVIPWPDQKDQGRFEVTKNDADKMMFKVPSLRNVAKTQPYYHDGSIATLNEAVKLMAKHQAGKELSDADTASIVAFLGALTGEIPADLAKEPVLPASTAKTPKADKG